MTDQHNSNIPNVTNVIAEDISDIRENLEYHKDCFQQICEGWSDNSLVALKVDILADDSVGEDQIVDDSITNAMMQGDSVDTYELIDEAVTTAKIADDQITQAKMYDDSVGQAELKVSTAATSYAITGNNSYDFTLPGGTYGLTCIYFKASVSTYIKSHGYNATATATTTYAVIPFRLSNTDSYQHTGYLQQSYVTASGEVFWYIVMRDKATKNIIAQYCGPDHPCMPQNKDPEDYPHPWVDEFDESKHELIVINPDSDILEDIRKSRSKSKLSILETIENEYSIDETAEPDWVTKEVTIGLPPEWERKQIGTKIKPVKKQIPKPSYIKTASLKAKQKEMENGGHIHR